MCMQCAAVASVSVASASGIRAWLRAHEPAWCTPGRMRGITVALLASAVLAAGLLSG